MNRNPLLNELHSILSETRNTNTLDIDLLSTDQILQKINEEDQKVALAIKPALDRKSVV